MQEYHELDDDELMFFPDWTRFPSPATPGARHRASSPPITRARTFPVAEPLIPEDVDPDVPFTSRVPAFDIPAVTVSRTPSIEIPLSRGTRDDPLDVDAPSPTYYSETRGSRFSKAPTTPSDPASRERSLERDREDFDFRMFSATQSEPSKQKDVPGKGKEKEETKWDLILHPIWSSTAHCSLVRWTPPLKYNPKDAPFSNALFPLAKRYADLPTASAQIHFAAVQAGEYDTTSDENSVGDHREHDYGGAFDGAVDNDVDYARAIEDPQWAENRARRRDLRRQRMREEQYDFEAAREDFLAEEREKAEKKATEDEAKRDSE